MQSLYTEPNDDWTIEELLLWTLAQYQNMAIERTEQYTESLKDYCERECEDIMELGSMAMEMAQNNENKATATAKSEGAKSPTKSNSQGLCVEVLVTSGAHEGFKALLRPKPNTPCFIGRSKGKKFIKNGISLHKDQEVSTTHAKIIVEGGTIGLAEGSNAASNEPKFYFVDLGSTNGTFLNGETIEPESKVLLEEGLELKVGGSNLKFMLG